MELFHESVVLTCIYFHTQVKFTMVQWVTDSIIKPLHIQSFNTLRKRALGKHCGKKGEIAQDEQFHLFPQCFLCNLYLKIL